MSNTVILGRSDEKSEIDIVSYLRAMEGIKMIFEDKIPIEAYGRVKQEVERFTITKDRVKVVDFDKLQDHVICSFQRYSAFLTHPLDQIYHAFTVRKNFFILLKLFEIFFMNYNELLMLMEILDLTKMRIELD